MKQVDFYLISNRVVDAKYKLASRLANKLQRLDQRALVVTQDAAATINLDRVMWSFNDTSFLAHDTLSHHLEKNLLGDTQNPAPAGLSSVQIGESSEVSPQVLEVNHDVLINLTTQAPMFSHHFLRIAEIVEQDEESKTTARKRYKDYQTEGFEMKTHHIEL